MANLMFVKNEVMGKTKDEAIKAAAPMNLMVDATQAYKKWAKENITSEDNVKEWMKDYLRKKKFDKPGIGAYIVTQTGVQDTRERPYTYENVVTEGRMATERTYEVRRVDNGDLVVSLSGDGATKDAAIKAAKEIMADVKADLNIEVVYRVKDGKNVVGRLKYTPSVNAQKGRYIFFGNEVAGF